MIWTVCGTKGGIGKTTTAVALAYEANSQGHHVAILDVDPQGSAFAWCHDLAIHRPDLNSPGAITALEAELGGTLIVDVPPGAASQAIAAIEAADIVIATTGLGPLDIEGLEHLISIVDPNIIVPVRWDKRRQLHSYALRALADRYGTIVSPAIPQSASVEWSQAEQDPLPTLSTPAIAYREVLAMIFNIESQLADQPPRPAA